MSKCAILILCATFLVVTSAPGYENIREKRAPQYDWSSNLYNTAPKYRTGISNRERRQSWESTASGNWNEQTNGSGNQNYYELADQNKQTPAPETDSSNIGSRENDQNQPYYQSSESYDKRPPPPPPSEGRPDYNDFNSNRRPPPPPPRYDGYKPDDRGPASYDRYPPPRFDERGHGYDRPPPPPPRSYEGKPPHHRGPPPPDDDGPPPHHHPPPYDRRPPPPPPHRGPPPHDRRDDRWGYSRDHGFHSSHYDYDRRPAPDHRGGPPPDHYGRPPHDRGPPPDHRGGPPPHDSWPPPHRGGPPPHDTWPPPHRGGPPPHDRGPPPDHYGRPPPSDRRSPPDHYGRPPPRDYPPSHDRGPPPRDRGSQHNKPYLSRDGSSDSDTNPAFDRSITVTYHDRRPSSSNLGQETKDLTETIGPLYEKLTILSDNTGSNSKNPSFDQTSSLPRDKIDIRSVPDKGFDIDDRLGLQSDSLNQDTYKSHFPPLFQVVPVTPEG